ncbi:MAG: YqjD family protein [Rhizobiaceae bacterium]
MATTAKQSASNRAKAANEDLLEQIEILKREVAHLSAELNRSKKRSGTAAKKAAADSVEALKAQGEVAMEKLRENADELEAELAKHVREKPVTSLAIAAGIGFLLAVIARR